MRRKTKTPAALVTFLLLHLNTVTEATYKRKPGLKRSRQADMALDQFLTARIFTQPPGSQRERGHWEWHELLKPKATPPLPATPTPALPQTAPPARDQALRHMSLWDTSHLIVTLAVTFWAGAMCEGLHGPPVESCYLVQNSLTLTDSPELNLT